MENNRINPRSYNFQSYNNTPGSNLSNTINTLNSFHTFQQPSPTNKENPNKISHLYTNSNYKNYPNQSNDINSLNLSSVLKSTIKKDNTNRNFDYRKFSTVIDPSDLDFLNPIQSVRNLNKNDTLNLEKFQNLKVNQHSRFDSRNTGNQMDSLNKPLYNSVKVVVLVVPIRLFNF